MPVRAKRRDRPSRESRLGRIGIGVIGANQTWQVGYQGWIGNGRNVQSAKGGVGVEDFCEGKVDGERQNQLLIGGTRGVGKGRKGGNFQVDGPGEQSGPRRNTIGAEGIRGVAGQVGLEGSHRVGVGIGRDQRVLGSHVVAASGTTQTGAVKEKQIGEGACVRIGETKEGTKIGDVVVGTEPIGVGGGCVIKHQRIQTGDDIGRIGVGGKVERKVADRPDIVPVGRPAIRPAGSCGTTRIGGQAVTVQISRTGGKTIDDPLREG